MTYVLAIDQGTTSTRVLIYNKSLERVGLGQKSFKQYFPEPGQVEHNGEEIWTSVVESIRDALSNVKDPDFAVNKIASIGITNQRETFLVWDRISGKPLGNAIVWQDRRSADFCKALQKTAKGKMIEKLTGLVLDPYFSGPKLSLLLEGLESSQAKKDLAFGNIDTYLLWKLSNGKSHATDVSNASRTLLMNLKTLKWDDSILKVLKIPMDILPQIMPSDSKFGTTAKLGIIPDGIPIHGILGDQQAALFGQSCFEVGDSKITYGTGAFMLTNTGSKIVRSKGALSTIAWQRNGKVTYALESSVFIAGAAVQWLRDGLKMISKSSEVEQLAKSVESSDGVFFIPALSGLGTPYWIPQARGLIGGLTRGSTNAHVARACLEGIAHSVADTFESMKIKNKTKIIRVDGGASHNLILMQYQSDLLQMTLERPKDVETTVRGVAIMAALGAGIITDKDLKNFRDTAATFRPIIKLSESSRLKNVWKKRIKALTQMPV